ncbi:MAG: hypothetical protein M9919_13710 [Burkholderiaceae bacterium]|nr:hypothetical protein [Burkholderiaceae bacterium]
MQEEFLATPQAAEWLALHDPAAQRRTAAQWLTFLKGNAVPRRPVAYRLPVEKVAGRNTYSTRELAKFLEAEKMRVAGRMTRQMAMAMQASESGCLNQQWDGSQGRFYGQFDEKTKTPFVKLAIDQPLQTFRLSLQDAAKLKVSIDDAIVNAESIAEEHDPTYQRKVHKRRD